MSRRTNRERDGYAKETGRREKPDSKLHAKHACSQAGNRAGRQSSRQAGKKEANKLSAGQSARQPVQLASQQAPSGQAIQQSNM